LQRNRVAENLIWLQKNKYGCTEIGLPRNRAAKLNRVVKKKLQSSKLGCREINRVTEKK